MINVTRQKQPTRFSATVARPGREFLSRTSNPTREEWSSHAFWTEISAELKARYSHICAYTCHWIPADTGFQSVEHFKPKKLYPHLAYVWSNYRLVCGRLNGRKGDHEDVLDPFLVRNGWFVLDFDSMQVRPSDAISPELATAVEITIKRLKLNDDDTCVEARQEWITQYCKAPGIPFETLRRYAPFIAMELERQGMRDSIKEIYG
ncbi:MAG TPA: hypothetical protein VFE47_27700 [Tepidisphaeraceae bacterium]|nr:hypothetical protein [Tepidisphaeraceae bacterium]